MESKRPMTIGIDIGGTTTKIVSLAGEKILQLLTVKASDPVASASGALGKLLDSGHLSLADFSKVIVTGVGSSAIKETLIGLAVERVDEFIAIGLGGLFLSKLDKAIVVSMGTGTAIVSAKGKAITHIGGTGIGGGTLLGLARSILNISDFATIIDLAQTGSLKHIDLSVGDITAIKVGDLPVEATASNFGKVGDQADRSDYALGILNLIFQTIGVMAVLGARLDGEKNIVLIGKLANIPQAKEIFAGLARLYHLSFHIPQYAEYATAVGAAISRCSPAREGGTP
jgi:type II pantothenate kinase